jgi:hypothetical protein
MEMALIDARIRDEQRLATQTETNALGDARQSSGYRRPKGPVKYPDRSKTVLP